MGLRLPSFAVHPITLFEHDHLFILSEASRLLAFLIPLVNQLCWLTFCSWSCPFLTPVKVDELGWALHKKREGAGKQQALLLSSHWLEIYMYVYITKVLAQKSDGSQPGLADIFYTLFLSCSHLVLTREGHFSLSLPFIFLFTLDHFRTLRGPPSEMSFLSLSQC